MGRLLVYRRDKLSRQLYMFRGALSELAGRKASSHASLKRTKSEQTKCLEFAR